MEQILFVFKALQGPKQLASQVVFHAQANQSLSVDQLFFNICCVCGIFKCLVSSDSPEDGQFMRKKNVNLHF